jgi:hypothetical protein
MKAIKQPHRTGVRVQLTTTLDDGVGEKEIAALDTLRTAILAAMLFNEQHRRMEGEAAEEVARLKADMGACSVADQIRSISFDEAILEARTNDRYAERRDEFTVSGHVKIAYRSVTKEALVIYTLYSRISLDLIDAINAVYGEDFVTEEILPAEEPKPKPEKVKPEPKPKADKPAKAEPRVDTPAEPRETVELPLDAQSLLDDIDYRTLSPREQALYSAGISNGLTAAMRALDRMQRETQRDVQTALNRLHRPGTSPSKNGGNKKPR